MTIGRGLVVALALACAPAAAVLAQVPGQPPRVPPPAAPGARQRPKPDTARAPRPGVSDTAVTDTTGGDTTLVQWAEPDSVMRELLARAGYATTRYQGDAVTFDAKGKGLMIKAPTGDRAAVQRGEQVVVADSSIYYNDSTKIVFVRGEHIVLRDPSSGQADIIGTGSLEYNLRERSGRITNPVFAINNGELWFVRAEVGRPVLGDSAAGRAPVFYGRGGELTSCTDSIPDYHFAFTEIKKSGTNTLVARPAVLYIRDIPVMWLPFIFQDTRSGRRSGILPPRFGVSDIVRNSPAYRRNIENLGYYWALNDYMGAQVSMDWRSSAGGRANDPGWTRYMGVWQYRWLDRFLEGDLRTDYRTLSTGTRALNVSWRHNQQFTPARHLNADMNYTTNTGVMRQTTFDVMQTLGTVRSQLTLSDKIGPANINLGGSRTQYVGSNKVTEDYPSLGINTGALNLASWLVWTPTLSYRDSRNLHQQDPTSLIFSRQGDSIVSTRRERNDRDVAMAFATPLRIFGYDLGNSFSVSHQVHDYPELAILRDVITGEVRDTVTFAQTYRTFIDWTPSFQLPPMARNKFNISPSMTLSNVAPGAFWIRSTLTNGQWVHQSKRPSFGISAAPTIFGLLPGFGPFSRIRHSVTPTFGYSFAPAMDVDTGYLKATGQTRATSNLMGLRQNSIVFGLSQTFEAKVRTASDTGEGQKIKLLSMTFSALSYDFERAKATHRALSGFSTPNWTFNLNSELLPGVNVDGSYSLFEGNLQSDTARFKPYLETIHARFSISDRQNPLVVLHRLLGGAVPERDVAGGSAQSDGEDAAETQMMASRPIAGARMSGAQVLVPPEGGWSANLNFSLNRPRPPVGNGIVSFDPTTQCEAFRAQPLSYDECVRQANMHPEADAPAGSLTGTTSNIRIPATINVGGNFAFRLTPLWTAAWTTNYDFQRHQFAQHQVSLVRELHDWRAVFAFTQSPNGNFVFNFGVHLKAEPDLKFDYNRSTIRDQGAFNR